MNELTSQQEDYLLEERRERDRENQEDRQHEEIWCFIRDNKADLIKEYCEQEKINFEEFDEDNGDFFNFCKEVYENEN